MATTVPTTAEVFAQFTTKASEGYSSWAGANQDVLRQIAGLSTAAVSESVKVFMELQASALAAVKSGQDYVMAQQGRLQDLQKDPLAAYQTSVVDGVDGAQQAFKVIEASAAAVTKSAERFQDSAEKAGKGILGTYTTLAGDLKTLYVPQAAPAKK